MTPWVDEPTRARPSLARDLVFGNPRSPLDPLVARRPRWIFSANVRMPLASAVGKCQNQVPTASTTGMGPTMGAIRFALAVSAIVTAVDF